MSEQNRRFLLRERPTGRIDDTTFELDGQPVPEIADGEALVRQEFISVDPTNRAWIGETPTYLPPVGIGEVVRAGGIGRVVASRNSRYPEGALVQGLFGWQDYPVLSDAAPAFVMPEVPGVSPSAFLGVLGMTGLTAYVGIHDIGRPQEGETVVVSAAAGAVGSVAAQIAKIEGARLLDQACHDYLLGLDRNTSIVFQCHHGIRSQSAAEYFIRHGFRCLYNLEGGIDAWSQLVDGFVPRY